MDTIHPRPSLLLLPLEIMYLMLLLLLLQASSSPSSPSYCSQLHRWWFPLHVAAQLLELGTQLVHLRRLQPQSIDLRLLLLDQPMDSCCVRAMAFHVVGHNAGLTARATTAAVAARVAQLLCGCGCSCLFLFSFFPVEHDR